MNTEKLNIELDLLKAIAVIGEERVWNGTRYKKVSQGKWIVVSGQKFNKNPTNEERKFGENYSQFENKPKDAIEFLFKKKSGQVKNVFNKEGLGEIDLIWGNEERGLSHIIKRHVIEQNDFDTIDELAVKIELSLKLGKVGQLYEKGNKVNIKRNEVKLVLVKEVVFDKEDNFKDKHWILTSYDQSKSQKDKIRKATSEDIAFENAEEEIDNTYPGYSAQVKNSAGVGSGKDRYSSFQLHLSSETKDTSLILMDQQLDIEKAKKALEIGTEKVWGGKTYVKVANGWKLKGKGKGSGKEEDPTNKDPKQEEISGKKNSIPEAAKNASDKQLEAAIKDPKQKEEIKNIAKKELEERTGNSKGKEVSREEKKEFVKEHLKNSGLGDKQIKAVFSVFDIEEAYNNLQENIKLKKEEKSSEEKVEKRIEKLKEELTTHIDEKFKELSGFKKITQTYVKVDGEMIVLNMKGDDKYKAKKGSFYMESEKNESLQDFKKRVKEEFTKQQGGEVVVEKETPVKEEPKKTVKGSKQEQIKKHKEKEKEVVQKKEDQKDREGKDEFTKKAEEEIKTLISSNDTHYMSNKIKDLFVKNNSKIENEEREKFEIKLNSLQDEIKKEKSIQEIIDGYSEEELFDLKKIGKDFNGSNENRQKQLAHNSYLIEKGQKPYLTPLLYSQYEKEKYNIYDQSELSKVDANDKARELCYKDIYTASELNAMKHYTKDGYTEIRDFVTEERENLNKYYSESKIKSFDLKVKNLSKFIDKSPMKENIVLSRRVSCYNNINIFAYFQSLKPGDSYIEKSFTSFSLSQQNQFGDFQITCLAKKGQKFASVENYSATLGESEFIGQKGQRYKVLEVGTNSIVIEVVD